MPAARSATVRVAARDPGAANLLAAFLSAWTPPPGVGIDVWAFPQAAAIFRRGGFAPREFSRGIGRGGLERAWAAAAPCRLVVTGTSHSGEFDAELWELARMADTPSLAVIDQWTNLRLRLASGRPDTVATLDESQACEVRAMFPSLDVVVVGHPALAALAQSAAARSVSRVPRTDAEPVRVLFVSEHISHDVAAGIVEPYGFDEFDAFSVLHHSAAGAASAGVSVHIVVKFHPYEEPTAFERRIAELPKVEGLTVSTVAPAEVGVPWVEWADLVTGISSVLLLEAMALGRPVVSLQPGLRGEDTFVASRSGFAPRLGGADADRRRLTEFIVDQTSRRDLVARHRPFVSGIISGSMRPLAQWIEDRLQPA